MCACREDPICSVWTVLTRLLSWPHSRSAYKKDGARLATRGVVADSLRARMNQLGYERHVVGPAVAGSDLDILALMHLNLERPDTQFRMEALVSYEGLHDVFPGVDRQHLRVVPPGDVLGAVDLHEWAR